MPGQGTTPGGSGLAAGPAVVGLEVADGEGVGVGLGASVAVGDTEPEGLGAVGDGFDVSHAPASTPTRRSAARRAGAGGADAACGPTRATVGDLPRDRRVPVRCAAHR